MRPVWKVVPWVIVVLFATAPSVGAEDLTLQRRVDALERQVLALQAQVTALRQVVVVNGGSVEIRATGTLALSATAIEAESSGTMKLRGAQVLVNGLPPLPRTGGPVCMVQVPGGGASAFVGCIFIP